MNRTHIGVLRRCCSRIKEFDELEFIGIGAYVEFPLASDDWEKSRLHLLTIRLAREEMCLRSNTGAIIPLFAPASGRAAGNASLSENRTLGRPAVLNRAAIGLA